MVSITFFNKYEDLRMIEPGIPFIKFCNNSQLIGTSPEYLIEKNRVTFIAVKHLA